MRSAVAWSRRRNCGDVGGRPRRKVEVGPCCNGDVIVWGTDTCYNMDSNGVANV
jgi:hypothetical protein